MDESEKVHGESERAKQAGRLDASTVDYIEYCAITRGKARLNLAGCLIPASVPKPGRSMVSLNPD
jgi:hypothetical protein